MDLHQLIDVGFAVMAFFGGWVLKRVYHSIDELWRKHDEVTQRLTRLAIELPKQYVTKKRKNYFFTFCFFFVFYYLGIFLRKFLIKEKSSEVEG